jgi:carnitine 3-dehydrogenase
LVGFGKLACVGAGVVGSSWALQFALSGHDVVMQDVSEAILRDASKNIEKMLDVLIENGGLKSDKKKETLTRIDTTTRLDEIAGAEYVQESVVERPSVKAEVFKEIEKVVSENALIASSTSGLLLSPIQKVMKHPARTVIAHPFNPVHLIPLVEIVPGRWTSHRTVKTVYDFMLSLGKEPILLKREQLGFAADRIQFVVYREVLNLLDDGVVGVEDIEKIFKAGLGIRWAFMGPFTVQALAGGPKGLPYFYDHLQYTAEETLGDIKVWKSIPDSARKKAISEANNLKSLRGKSYKELLEWRDRKLIELLRYLGYLRT